MDGILYRLTEIPVLAHVKGTNRTLTFLFDFHYYTLERACLLASTIDEIDETESIVLMIPQSLFNFLKKEQSNGFQQCGSMVEKSCCHS